ncbi:MAG: hypothetical protein Q7S03_03525 [bacterium]|nr:hypothetical protein [bacterium]
MLNRRILPDLRAQRGIFLWPPLIVLLAFLLIEIVYYLRLPSWEIKSIDTMKISRDLSREKLNDSSFDHDIAYQMQEIALTGATHVAIGTPYDEEFYPYLEKWVKAARENKLKVWFRGNLSGWEGWFGYKTISAKDHQKMIGDFISKHSEIFQDGDIFTPCPECENGKMGDPREMKDLALYRKFLIDEYSISKEAFSSAGRKVKSGYFSMNFDVAKLVMDKETTKQLGGVVVIDDYTKIPGQLADNAQEIARLSGGRVIVGEFGAPIPDIHGDMSEEDQAKWIKDVFEIISKDKNVIGLNYWININGSTALWDNDGTQKLAVDIVRSFYDKPKFFPFDLSWLIF